MSGSRSGRKISNLVYCGQGKRRCRESPGLCLRDGKGQPDRERHGCERILQAEPTSVTGGDYPSFYRIDAETGVAVKGLSVEADGLSTAGRLKQGFTAVFDGIVGADQMRHFIFKLHTGSWGGIITRIIYFLSALIGATLPWTGYYLWLKKRGSGKRA